MTPANRLPVVGCHAKAKQRMMAIKSAARIRGGEGERGEPHVSKRRRLQNLQRVRMLQIPRQLLQENSFRWGLSFPQDEEGSGPHRTSLLLPLHTSPPFYFFLIKKLPLVFRAVASSFASNLSVDKAAEATGDDMRYEAAHEYLKWIVEKHEERKGGVQWMVGKQAWIIPFNYMWRQDTKGWQGFGVGEQTNLINKTSIIKHTPKERQQHRRLRKYRKYILCNMS